MKNNLVGMKFNKLTVIEFSHLDKWGNRIWKCECDCGNYSFVTSFRLKSGQTKSCGCFLKEIKRENMVGENYDGTAFTVVLGEYKKSSRYRSIEFSLTTEQAKHLFVGDCVYCGTKPSSNVKSQKGKLIDFIHNGIDRIDNSKGYIEGNVVSCCKKCNYAKRTMNITEWNDYLENLTRFRSVPEYQML